MQSVYQIGIMLACQEVYTVLLVGTRSGIICRRNSHRLITPEAQPLSEETMGSFIALLDM